MHSVQYIRGLRVEGFDCSLPAVGGGGGGGGGIPKSKHRFLGRFFLSVQQTSVCLYNTNHCALLNSTQGAALSNPLLLSYSI